MTKPSDSKATRSWRRSIDSTNYLISTSTDLLSHLFIQRAFSRKDMPWAVPLPQSDLNTMIANSLNLGLYISKATSNAPSKSLRSETKSAEDPETVSSKEQEQEQAEEQGLEQIGYARFITDYVTIYYLTDVVVSETHRGKGLAKWMIKCCEEMMLEKYYMRRAVLMASPGTGEAFYSKQLGMYDAADGREHLVCMTRKAYETEERAQHLASDQEYTKAHAAEVFGEDHAR